MWRLTRQLQRRICRDRVYPSFCFFSSSAQRKGEPPPAATEEPAHFMADYLVTSCGLSGVEALRVSKAFAHLKSPARPDAVLRLLRQEGLDDVGIRRAVLRKPNLLLADSKKTLEPKIRALQDAGLPRDEIARLVSVNPALLFLRDVRRRVEFWRQLVGTNENLWKTLRRDPRLLWFSPESRIAPALSLLRDLGIPDGDMGTLLMRTRSSLVTAKPDKIKTLVERVKSLGFSPGSDVFVDALSSVVYLSKTTFDAKSELLRSFGWTQAELTSVIRKYPILLWYSKKKIDTVMGFLLNEAGCEPSYVARYPRLIGYSIEKRLKPRLSILQSLKRKGLPAGSNGLWNAIVIPDDKFAQKYVIPYGGELPELLDAYDAILNNKASSNVHGL